MSAHNEYSFSPEELARTAHLTCPDGVDVLAFTAGALAALDAGTEVTARDQASQTLDSWSRRGNWCFPSYDHDRSAGVFSVGLWRDGKYKYYLGGTLDEARAAAAKAIEAGEV